jgi:PDZ domain-containing protein
VTATLPPEVPLATPPQPPARRRLAGPILLSLTIALLVAAGVGFAIRLPYVIFSPGDATPVSTVVRIQDAKTYRHRGEVLFLTVRVTNSKPNLWRYLYAELDSDQRIIGWDDYYGGRSQKQDERENVQLMDESQKLATKVALERLGYTVPFHGDGAVIRDVSPDGPAAGKLRDGDLITGIDGTTVETADQIGTIVRARPAGTTFTFTVKRGDETVQVPVTTGTAPSGEIKGKPYVGIAPVTRNPRFDFPVKVSIDPGPVSGPSAGLAFTLTIVDELSPGDLTGGKKVAVTGTIESDGTVGLVGGVAQKTVAARDAGAKLFLVPVGEEKEARETAGTSMKVVPVRTLDDALKALRADGGAPVEEVGKRAA